MWFIIIEIPLFVVFFLILFGIALGEILLSALPIILLVILALIIVLIAIYKWEWKAVIAIISILVIATGIMAFIVYRDNYNTSARIYIATADCAYWDTDYNQHIIPQGAVVARYTHPTERSPEPDTVSHTEYCLVYYNGNVSKSTVSEYADFPEELRARLSRKVNFTNDWHLDLISKTTLGKVEHTDWWNVG